MCMFMHMCVYTFINTHMHMNIQLANGDSISKMNCIKHSVNSDL